MDRAQFLDRPRLKQVSNAETGVSGNGQLDTRRGWVPFSYSCVYNIRNGGTDHVSVKSSAGSGGGSSSGGDDAGKVVGALIGLAIAGAIVGAASKDNDKSSGRGSDDGWWSPEGGVTCNSYQSACYRDGKFSAKWTHRIYQ